MFPLHIKDLLLEPQTPWELSQELSQRLQPVTTRFKAALLKPTDPESIFILKCFMESKPPGFSITKITCIYNLFLHMNFLTHLSEIEEQAKKFPASSETESVSQERKRVIKKWKELTHPFSPLKVVVEQEQTLQHAKVLPLWSGTSKEEAQSICTTGFTHFGKDGDHFGNGLFFTDSAHYASMFSKGLLVLSWVSMRKPYAVVSDKFHPQECTDMLTLKGKGAYQNYDAHFVPVASTLPGSTEYYPCFGHQKPDWNALVVFQEAQTLPSFMIEIGTDLMHPPCINYTFASCYAACRAGDRDQIERWIEEDKKRVYEEDEQGKNLLFAAVLGNQLSLLTWLSALDPTLLKKCKKDGWNLMHVAAAEGHVEIVVWLYKNAPSLLYSGLFTPLHAAAFCEQTKVLESFLEEVKKNTSLIEEIAQKPCPQTLLFLLEKGCDPNQANKFKKTLLHLAAYKGQLANVEILVEKRALLNAQNLSKETPLYLAVAQNHLPVVHYLLDRDADPRMCSIEGDTLLHVAASNGYTPLLQILLMHPLGKKLLHLPDGEGKHPIHRAVCGNPKFDVVQLLLEAGAYPNALDTADYTPLHLAAKNGHTSSAQLLDKAGSSWNPNKNNITPLDMAISSNQNSILHVLLETKKTLPEEPLSQDNEGYYYRRLVTAKTECLIEEQIVHLIRLGLYYIDKKDLFKGAKTLNGALHLISTHKPNLHIQKMLFKYLASIESDFFAQHQLTGYQDPTLRVLKYRRQLSHIRSQAQKMLQAKESLENVQIHLTDGFKEVLSSHIHEIQMWMGPPPVQWACIGRGSMANGEMCPHSSIGFAFILEKETPDALAYFHRLYQILALQILNLGETSFPIFESVNNVHPSPTPNGFSLDNGGNPPNIPGPCELIGSPQQLASFQTHKWIDGKIILSNALSTVCTLGGNEKLVTKYREALKKEIKKEHYLVAFRLLGRYLQEFRSNISQEKEITRAFSIEKELYNPFQGILGCLSLIFELKERNTFSRLTELVKLGVLSLEGVGNLKIAIQKVRELRMQAHLFYKDGVEFFFHPEAEETKDPGKLYLEGEFLKSIEEIYKTLIPFHRCAEEFYQTRNTAAFKISPFYENSPSIQGEAFQKTLNYMQAQSACLRALSRNSNDVDAQLCLGLIEQKMEKSQKALLINLRALELGREKYGENHPFIVQSYYTIGTIYDSLENYDKAIEFYQKALLIFLQIFGENHLFVAINHHNIGEVYKNREENPKALEHHQMALKIRIQVLGENHPDVASSYYCIGDINGKLKSYSRALASHQKALKIRLRVLGENHLDVALSYSISGHYYYKLAEYGQALEVALIALKIRLGILRENHPDLIGSYNDIGAIYENLRNYEKALEFYQKALGIRIQTLGKSHLDVALSYNTIGFIYHNLGRYLEALEFYEKDLEISLTLLGENRPDVATTYNNMGDIYNQLENYEKGFEFCQKALQIRYLRYGENHPDVASSYNNIAGIHEKLKDYEKALEFYQKALKIFFQAYRKNHPNVQVVSENLIVCAKKASPSQINNICILCGKFLGEKDPLVQQLFQLSS